MINFNDLEQLVAFYHSGTLSEASKRMNISQSAITRNMQKLEAELGVQLFQRTKNSIKLNDTGVLAAKHSETILNSKTEMFSAVRNFAEKNVIISLGSCSLVATEKHLPISAIYQNSKIVSEIRPIDLLIDGLYNDKYQLIILPFCILEDGLICKKIEEERLMFCLPANHRLADRKTLTFADMNGESILVYREIGFWQDIIKNNLPDSHLLVQQEDFSFFELISSSSVPCFTSDLLLDYINIGDRAVVPISDSDAVVPYYLVTKKENMKKYERMFE